MELVVFIVGLVMFLLFVVVLPVLVGRAAERKGRSKAVWTVVALFFLPIAAILVACMKGDVRRTSSDVH